VFSVVLLMSVSLSAGETGAPWRRHVIDGSSRGADGVRTADVNGDGRTDLVTGWEQGGLIRVYVNPGPEKSKQAWPAVTVGSVRSPEDAVFADLDGDGAVDVISSCEGRERAMFVHFAPREASNYLDASAWTTEAVPASRGAGLWMFCLPMQVDGRGGVDLVAGSKGENAAVGWFESPADPRRLDEWTWHPIYEAGWMMSLVPADMDGDGDQDVLITDRKGKHRGCHWLENPGPGPRQTQPWTVHTIGGTGREMMFLTHAGLDGDARKEVVAAVRPEEILVFRREGDAWTTQAVPLPPQAGNAKGVAVTDVDLDGRNDLLFSCEHAEAKHGVMWLSPPEEDRGSAWDAHPISGREAGTKFDLLELLDLDADGDQDVITCEERENLGVIWYENPAR
ncbi:MAG: FG-GAP repeat domain-containing protein, partial [Planctomycetaceae bacterium]